MLLTKLLSSAALISGARAFAPAPRAGVTLARPICRAAEGVDDIIGASDVSDGRRAFLSASAAAVLLGFAPTARAEGADYKAVAGDIASLIKKDPNKGPTLVRLVSGIFASAVALAHRTSR